MNTTATPSAKITTYRAEFTGKVKGAIGSPAPFLLLIDAETPEAATLKLYDTHEHLERLTLTPLTSQALAYLLEAQNLAVKKATAKSARSGNGPGPEFRALYQAARRTWHRWNNALELEAGKPQAFPPSPTSAA